MDVISFIQKESGGHCFVAGLDKIVGRSLLDEDPLVWHSEDLHYSGEWSSVVGMYIVEVKGGW